MKYSNYAGHCLKTKIKLKVQWIATNLRQLLKATGIR